MDLKAIEVIEAQNREIIQLRETVRAARLKCSQLQREVKEHRECELRFAP